MIKSDKGACLIPEATYELKKFKSWKMEIHFAVLDFYNRFHTYPEHVCASKITFERIELLAGKTFEAVQKTYFGSYKYSLNFSVCNNLADNQICLFVSQPKSSVGKAPVNQCKAPTKQLFLKFD